MHVTASYCCGSSHFDCPSSDDATNSTCIWVPAKAQKAIWNLECRCSEVNNIRTAAAEASGHRMARRRSMKPPVTWLLLQKLLKSFARLHNLLRRQIDAFDPAHLQPAECSGNCAQSSLTGCLGWTVWPVSMNTKGSDRLMRQRHVLQLTPASNHLRMSPPRPHARSSRDCFPRANLQRSMLL